MKTIILSTAIALLAAPVLAGSTTGKPVHNTNWQNLQATPEVKKILDDRYCATSTHNAQAQAIFLLLENEE